MSATRTSNKLTMIEVARLICDDGRLWPYWSSITCLAVCWGESGGDAYIRPVVLNPTSPAHLSLDIGLMQINTHWHPRHTIPQLLDPAENMQFGIDLALLGQQPWKPNWTYWGAYKNGTYMRHHASAKAAINVVKAERQEPPL
jgi:hypothetical protein